MRLKQRQDSPITRTYAAALFGAARRQDILQRVAEESKVLLRIIQQNPRLLLFLESPHVTVEDKLALLDRTFKGRLSPLLINLLHLLATRRRTTFLDETLILFQELVEQAEGIHQASVTSAIELSFQDKLRLKGTLEKYTNSRLKIDYFIEPELIGGIIFRFRDLLVDGSLASALAELRGRMISRTLTRETA